MALVLSAAQMRAVDRAVIAKLGLPGLALMENAGRGVADVVMGTLVGFPNPPAMVRRPAGRERSSPAPHATQLDVCIVCGTGQNGGDGFGVARHLLRRGAKVRVLLALPAEKIAGDAAIFAQVFRALAADAVCDLSREGNVSVWREHLAKAQVIVDALFGTGLRSDVAGVPAAAITAMNAADALRVAVDIPSGLDADTGKAHGLVVEAHVTATMGARKLGLVLDADAPVGRLEVVDLGVACESVLFAALAEGPLCHWLEPAMLAPLVPKRGPAGHKGTAGQLLAIAGSTGKTGAALLAGRAGLRAGAGMVTLATTAAAQPALDAKVIAEMTACYAEGDAADPDSFAMIALLATRMKAALVGPGIPTGQGMAELIRQLVAELPLPLVVDADALNLLGDEVATFASQAAAERILTPHPGEMSRLCGRSTAEVQQDRLGFARRLAGTTRAVVVLKGARTVIAMPDGEAFVNPTANPALGTAGSGDVLSGAIGAFLAQGLCAKDAACLGVFVHGAAAEVATRTLGADRLIATDLPDAIARACEALRPV
jgi:NAD(P)H-hydrate epimerase